MFSSLINETLDFNEKLDKDLIINFLKEYKASGYSLENDENTWFNNVKVVANKFNFCLDNKLYKADPTKWVGNVNDACEIIRVVLTLRRVTPNLFAIMQIMGKDEIDYRIDSIITQLSK